MVPFLDIDYDGYFAGNKFGNRLLYVAIALNTSLNPSTLGYQDGLPIHDNWEEFIQNEVSLLLFMVFKNNVILG